jgi:hypothetical protein
VEAEADALGEVEGGVLANRRASTEPREWPTAMSLPQSRSDISTVELDDNIAIYDEVGRVLVLLNVSAFAVLESCDGSTPFKSIVANLAHRYDADLEVVREDVWRTVRKLASMGLVADAG